MRAIIEENDGLYIIRINRDDGLVYDVFVVDEVELKTIIKDKKDNSLRDILTGCNL